MQWEWQYLGNSILHKAMKIRSGAYVRKTISLLVPIVDLGRFRLPDGNGNENNQDDIW